MGVYCSVMDLLTYFFLSFSFSLHQISPQAKSTAAANVTLVLNVQYSGIQLIITNKYGKNQIYFYRKVIKLELFLIHIAIGTIFTCTH